MLKEKQRIGHKEHNMTDKVKDDQFGFSRSLDGKIETWTEGRIDKDGKNWLRKYQGKSFNRKPSLFSRWIKRS